MQIQMNQVLRTVMGTELMRQNPDTKATEVMTLRMVCAESLLTYFSDEMNIPAEEKHKRFKLAQRITMSQDEPVKLTVEELTLVKKLVGRLYGPVVVGPAFDLLEGESLDSHLKPVS